jgi:hypothetical protein
MAYVPFQDGTQAFGIPDSPVTVSAVDYIAEDIQINANSSVVEIKDPNGVPTGQVFIPGVTTGSAKLQLATLSTAIPPRQGTFSLQGATWILENVGTSYTQGNYTYVNVTFRMQINS